MDPDALESGTAEPDLTEQFMPWNRPHRLQLDFGYRVDKGDHPKLWGWTVPDAWNANFYYTVQSGRPYTPTTIRNEQTGKRNSKNAPMEHVLDMKLRKSFLMRASHSFGLTFEGRNLLNSKILRTVDPNTGEAPEVGKGIYTILSPDTSREKLAQQLDNPSFYAEPRSLRLSMEVNF